MEKEITDIVQQAIHGNEEAFEKLYKSYKNRVYFMAYHFFLNKELAEDVVQDVFIEVYKNIHSLSSAEAFHCWIMKITYRLCVRLIRSHKMARQEDSEGMMEEYKDSTLIGNPEKAANHRILQEAIQGAIEELRWELKIVCYLRFYEELSIDEIAQLTNISKGTIKSRIHRSKKHIKKQLIQDGISPSLFGVVFLSPSMLNSAYREWEQKVFGYAVPMGEAAVSSTAFIWYQVLNWKVLSGLLLVSGTVYLALFPFLTKEREGPVIEEEKLGKIVNIIYDKEYRNKPLTVTVQVEGEYDYFTLNGEKTDKITQNGIYEVCLMEGEKCIDKQEVNITNIDLQSPYQVKTKNNQNLYKIYYADDLSGIDPSTIKVYGNGKNVDYSFDSGSNSIDVMVDSSVKYEIHISDYAGNEAITYSYEQ